MKLPKGLYVRGKIIWMKYYSSASGQNERESTRLTAVRENVQIAKRMREDRITEARKPKFILCSSNLTLSQGKELYFQNNRLAEKTKSIYGYAVDYFMKINGDLPIPSIGVSHWERLKGAWIAQELSQNSQSIYSRALQSIFNSFVKQKMIAENPITPIPIDKHPPKRIPQNDLDELLNSLYKNNRDGYNLIKFLQLSGLRIGEAIALDWNNFDLEENLIDFRNFKGKREDLIPILEPLKEHLISMNPKKEGKLLAYSNTSCDFFYREQARLWGKKDSITGRLEEKELRRYSIHQLRKTFITELVEKGNAPLDVQMLARHKNFATTNNFYIEKNIQALASRVNKKGKPE